MTNTGGVRVEGRRGRGRRCRCDAGGDDDVGRHTGTEEGVAEGNVGEVEGEARVEVDAAVPKEEMATSATGGGAVAATPLDVDEDAPPAVTARNGGQAGGEEAAATPRMVTARPTGAWARRQRRLEVAGDTGEREEGCGERRCGHGVAREEAKMREQRKRIPFYSGGELAGHGRGRNGAENGCRRPWKVAGDGAAVPGD
uniref:Pr1-like protein n=2 Tax=Oryza sativa subsp. japonica TaxID=39947 RepID=Q10IQ6_ORYSJ|nr:hypothetical protein [Oryza sativa Japonica Group]ABF96933.1 hypothetical protein LOC_Os03g33400 [Oryza sativa Japonica Group]